MGEAQNLTIAVYHADAGTEHANKLAVLASMSLADNGEQSWSDSSDKGRTQ